jgi:chitodextrinase
VALGVLAVTAVGVPVALTRYWIAATAGRSAETGPGARAHQASGGAVPTGLPAGGTDSGTWQPDHAYQIGDLVTYDGRRYLCLQAHTSQSGWEPPNVPALWQAE